jgi:hypothetical protein
VNVDSNQVYGVLGIGLGLYSVVTRKMGFGALTARPQFTISGPIAVVLGIAVMGVGTWLLFSRT